MSFYQHDELETFAPWPGCLAKQVVGKELGAASVTALEVIIEPGSEIPLHIHPGHEEDILIVLGTATCVIGEAIQELEAPATMLVPKDIVHQVRNESNTPIKVIGIFPTIEVARQYV